jgi:ubiquinone biosynthesis protein COQ4
MGAVLKMRQQVCTARPRSVPRLGDTVERIHHRPRQWGLAFKALLALGRDTGRTDHVFTIISALTGDSLERTYQAFRRTPYGLKLLSERSSLAAALSDHERLARMPEGSLGRAYLKFMENGKLAAEGLMAAREARVDPYADLDLDPDRRYLTDRLRDMHDLWHVLSGYGSDDTGEIANLWFSVGQFGNPGMAFIAFFGMLGGQMDWRLSWPRYCLVAYRRGLHAARLVSEPIEAALDLPLDEARRRLGILPPERAHPEGLRRGYRRDGQLGAAGR